MGGQPSGAIGEFVIGESAIGAAAIDQSSILARLKSVLPARWFPAAGGNSGTPSSPTPLLDGALSGTAALMAWAHALIGYARSQARIATATDGWLDIASSDLFGAALPRLAGEADAAFSARIRAHFPPRGSTRPAIIAGLAALAGVTPRVIEPWRIADTGAWDAGVSYWDIDTQANPARWGDASVRYQGFIVTPLPPSVAGANPVRTWDDSAYWDEPNGYGGWFLDLPNSPTLAQLYALITRLHVEGTIVWTQIGSPSIT